MKRRLLPLLLAAACCQAAAGADLCSPLPLLGNADAIAQANAQLAAANAKPDE